MHVRVVFRVFAAIMLLSRFVAAAPPVPDFALPEPYGMSVSEGVMCQSESALTAHLEKRNGTYDPPLPGEILYRTGRLTHGCMFFKPNGPTRVMVYPDKWFPTYDAYMLIARLVNEKGTTCWGVVDYVLRTPDTMT